MPGKFNVAECGIISLKTLPRHCYRPYTIEQTCATKHVHVAKTCFALY